MEIREDIDGRSRYNEQMQSMGKEGGKKISSSYIGLVLCPLVIFITTLALRTQGKIKFGVEAFSLSIIPHL